MKLTKTGQIFGSPHYMAPEQCRGGKADARSDIYAMGCLMFAALAGKPPFVSEDLVEILQAHMDNDPPLLPPIKGENFQRHRMESIIWRCMSKGPDDRYQSAEALKKDLLAAKEKPKSLDRASNLFTITSFRLKNFAATPKRILELAVAFISVAGGASIAVWYILLGQNIPYTPAPQDLTFQIAAKTLNMSAEDISRQNLLSREIASLYSCADGNAEKSPAKPENFSAS
jgi:serine/threonine protein kinase